MKIAVFSVVLILLASPAAWFVFGQEKSRGQEAPTPSNLRKCRTHVGDKVVLVPCSGLPQRAATNPD